MKSDFSYNVQCESKNPPACGLRFSGHFFSQTLENFKSIFTHLLYVPIYARLYNFLFNYLQIRRSYAEVVDNFADRCLWLASHPDLLLL